MDQNKDRNREPDTQQKRKKADRRGFYAAIAICVLAIGIAAWSTYDTMMDFIKPAAVSNTDTPADAEPVVTPDADDPETEIPSGHGHATAPAVMTDTPTEEKTAESVAAPTEPPTETPSPAPEVKEPAKPVAAPVQTYAESESYIRPVKSGEMLTPYTEVPVYSETMRDYRSHCGADYKAERGETVHAAANGIVKSTHTDMLLGNMIVIEHGDAVVSYCGLGETFLVKPGEVVEKGQDIGSVTAAPFESAMEPHLHLEAEQHGKKIDPEVLFK